MAAMIGFSRSRGSHFILRRDGGESTLAGEPA
jgi:hypothetical protein